MSQRTNPDGRDRSELRPGHHISSIAHLFFDNNSEVEQSRETVCEYHLLVVGTGRDTSAPYTAVGLGHHLLDQSTTVGERRSGGSSLPIRQVFFAEPSPVCFSGVSHLLEGSFRPPVQGESVPWPLNKSSHSSVLRLFTKEA